MTHLSPASCFARSSHICLSISSNCLSFIFQLNTIQCYINYLMKTFVNKDSRKYVIVIHKIYFYKLYLAIKIFVEFFNHI